MKRRTQQFDITNVRSFRQKALAWADVFPLCCFLDSNDYTPNAYRRYDLLVGVGNIPTVVASPESSSFDRLKKWHSDHHDWLMGYLGYDLKNEIESLTSANSDALQWPDMMFFQPQVVLEVVGRQVRISCLEEEPSVVFDQVCNFVVTKNTDGSAFTKTPDIRPVLSKEYYLDTVETIRQHIIAGDVYEMNFCQAFFADNYNIDPLVLFEKLNAVSKSPFAAYLRWHNVYLCCASPERFLQKRGNRLISQPIKGTISRGRNEKEDVLLQQRLHESEKDRAENVMIVDLVRNDLARSCVPGSVRVEELFGVYPFEQVWQMISTVGGELRPGVHFAEAIKNAFPMGSMTGAPKVMSMQLIERYEKTKRGLYSGAVGYIRPDGDFDFNVVIRSILYDVAKKYLSFQVGGAIVYDSVPELEYAECLLKAGGIFRVLSHTV